MDNKILGEQGLRTLLSAINNKLKGKVSTAQLQTTVSEEVTAKLTEAKESGEFDGLNAEMYSHKLYKVYSLADIEKLCSTKTITEFKVINCGEAFSHTSSGGDYTAINTGDIFEVAANNGTLTGLSYLDNSTVETEEGTLIEWYEPDGNGGYKARYTGVLNGTHPHIGEDGNWYIGETNTGVSASGEKYVLSEEDKAAIVEAVIAAINTTE